MLAQVTAGTPKTAGLFYDDSYDRTEYPAKAFYTSEGLPDPGCMGQAGTELTNFEALDKSSNYSTALVADYTGGGTLGQVYTQLDPDHMQRKLVDGKCVPVYPHEYVRDWIGAVGAKTAYIERGSPWENGFIESFNARLRDELLDGEIFYSLAEARIVIEGWRRHYNTSDPMGHWATNRRLRRFSFRRSPRGRLRNLARCAACLAQSPSMN
jgi:hypothetical protein